MMTVHNTLLKLIPLESWSPSLNPSTIAIPNPYPNFNPNLKPNP